MDAVATRPDGISLRSTLSRRQIVGGKDIRVRSVRHHWEDCEPGDVFVAMSGVHGDTHADATRAVNCGAAAVVTEHLLPVGVPQCIVPDSREAYAHICMALADHPDHSLITIGVTGTTGKTCASLILSSILAAADRSICLLHDCESSANSERYAPQSTVARQLRQAADVGFDRVVMESSSRSLAQRHLAAVHFDMAVFTNVRRDHLDLHGSLTNYRNAKSRLLEQLKDDGLIIANGDDPYIERIVGDSMFPVLRYGVQRQAELMASVIESCPSQQTFLLEAGGDLHTVNSAIVGTSHLYNCLAAAATAMAMGIDMATIVRGIEQLKVIPRRMERVECGQPFAVYLDVASTPEMLSGALKAASQVVQGRIWCVVSPSLSRPVDQRPLLGRVAEQYADRAVITRCAEFVHEVSPYFDEAHDVIDGYQHPARSHVIPSRQAALEWVIGEAQPGDAVVIAGCADPFANEEVAATEGQLVRDLLYGIGSNGIGRHLFAFPPVSPN